MRQIRRRSNLVFTTPCTRVEQVKNFAKNNDSILVTICIEYQGYVLLSSFGGVLEPDLYLTFQLYFPLIWCSYKWNISPMLMSDTWSVWTGQEAQSGRIMIMVSCGYQLYAVKLYLRPHISINMAVPASWNESAAVWR